MRKILFIISLLATTAMWAQHDDLKPLTVGKKTFRVADVNDNSTIYKTEINKQNCFVVISKNEYRLYVYERVGRDTVLVAHYPVCYAENKGQKTRVGDKCTPHSRSQHDAFKVSQIQNASAWKHDFKDGRGSIPSYGNWFIRLQLTGSLAGNRSIGIHGCGANEESVPGRDSEGCIRLRNADIKDFHDRFAFVGIPVVIRSFDTNKYPFEVAAEKALGNKYVKPVPGNPLLKK